MTTTMRCILVLLGLAMLCSGCMSKTINYYLTINESQNATILVTDSQHKPLTVDAEVPAVAW